MEKKNHEQKKLLEKHEKTNVKTGIWDLEKVSKQRLIQAPNFGPTSEFECTSLVWSLKSNLGSGQILIEMTDHLEVNGEVAINMPLVRGAQFVASLQRCQVTSHPSTTNFFQSTTENLAFGFGQKQKPHFFEISSHDTDSHMLL